MNLYRDILLVYKFVYKLWLYWIIIFSVPLSYTAIIYSVDKYLGYVAPNPPSNILKEFAKKNSVEIVYVPLATFSSETLRKLRHFHVLGNKRLRKIADDYII